MHVAVVSLEVPGGFCSILHMFNKWRMSRGESVSTCVDACVALLQIFIGSEFVGGADIVEEMHTSGELKKLLQG